MPADLTLHELTGSPNNVKVRIALGFKGLSYERKPITMDGFPGNRSARWWSTSFALSIATATAAADC